MEDVASFVFEFFMERHIVLKEEWISDVLAFLTSFLESEDVLRNRSLAANLVYEQWKYADIGDSTYPLLKQLFLTAGSKKVYLTQPVVLQINSVVDIGSPFHSQFSALVYEFVDNSGFDPLPEMEQGHGLNSLDAKPRRMLSFMVSDGETELRAVEYHSIKFISLLTKPGSKILLTPPILCRKGVLLLKPGNVQVLGGDVESHFQMGRPLQVMATKLSATIPASSKKQEIAKNEKISRSQAVAGAVGESRQRDKNSYPKTPVSEIVPPGNSVLNENDFGMDTEEDHFAMGGRNSESEYANRCFENYETKPCDEKDQNVTLAKLTSSANDPCRSSLIVAPREVSSRFCSKPVAQISPMNAVDAQMIHDNGSSIELEESPPDFDAELERLRASGVSFSSQTALSGKARESEITPGSRIKRSAGKSLPAGVFEDSIPRKRTSDTKVTNQSSLLSLYEEEQSSGLKKSSCVAFDPTRRPMKLGIQGYLKTETVVTKKQDYGEATVSENLCKKVKVEVIDLEDEEIMDVSSSVGSLLNTSIVHSPSIKHQENPEDEVVVKFKRLSLTKIADAVKQMRFAVGSCRRPVQAIIVDIVDSLRIVDGMWTMKVNLQDESVDGFVCLVDNATLSSLIGLTPAEAMEVRASTDMERRRDGQRRLAAVEEQLKRLDLILEVEMFSGGRADPVIRRIQTLMQALDVL